MAESWREIDGHLVGLPMDGRHADLDGFWAHGRRRAPHLAVFLHGMGGNFYRSRLKREVLARGPASGFDALSFHNQGHLDQVADERFGDCVPDIEAVIAFARRKGYRGCVLIGHSTGCQKAIHYQALKQDPYVKALVLLAPADDYALARRDLGARYNHWIKRARQWVAEGRGEERLPECCHGFSARRFLSASDPRRAEARVLDYEGPMTQFRRVRAPMWAAFGDAEQFAVLSAEEMGRRLVTRNQAEDFVFRLVPGGDHGFKGVEARTVSQMYRWLKKVVD